MASEFKISVIVPVYNTAEFLEECLISLSSQSLDNFEVICVDDCSTDSSLEIIKKKLRVDSRFRLIQNKNNLGVSASRNAGLESANGEYVYFLDSDDFLEENALEILYSKARENDYDVVFTGAYEYFSKEKKIPYDCPVERADHLTGKEFYLHDLSVYVNGAAWWFIFRRQIIIDHPTVRFPVGAHPHEDTTFSFMLLTLSRTFSYTKENLINYRQHPNMVMRQISKSKRKQNLRSIVICLDKIKAFLVEYPEFYLSRKDAFNGLYYALTRKNILHLPLRYSLPLFSMNVSFFVYRKKITKSGYLQIKVFKFPVFRKKIK